MLVMTIITELFLNYYYHHAYLFYLQSVAGLPSAPPRNAWSPPPPLWAVTLVS